jgi:hypothetical protein
VSGGNEDAFSDYDAILAAAPTPTPWHHVAGADPVYLPDYALLGRLLSVPVSKGAAVVSGRFARGIDSWLAYEFRRAGFNADEVWPRPTRPRVMPRDIALLLEKLPSALASQVRDRLPKISAVAPTDARILGRAYDKQVDVCIARWERGPELLVSTKAQLSSFGKNLPNRFEEAYGDAGNLRSRYPLASVGFFFVQRATILVEEPDAYERTVDMMRKLRDIGTGNGYVATGLLLVDWDDLVTVDSSVRVIAELPTIPADVAPPQFFSALLEQLLTVTPVQHHVEVRQRREGRKIRVPEADRVQGADAESDCDHEVPSEGGALPA